MSSIYKKGRDGYFYYQTYVFNPKTGKKDKRIFHSLGTKSRSVAERKKIDLDYKYDKKLKDQNFQPLSNLSVRNVSLFLIFSFFIFFSFYSFKTSNSSEKKVIITNDTLSTNFPIGDESKLPNLNSGEKEFIAKATESNSSVIDKKEHVSDLDTVLNIPKYKILNEEKVSERFNQIKVSATVISYTSSEELELLCRKIRSDYYNSKNIIVCLYDNAIFDKRPSSDFAYEMTKREKENYWIAMYSYHETEGEYFDDKPNSYLGKF